MVTNWPKMGRDQNCHAPKSAIYRQCQQFPSGNIAFFKPFWTENHPLQRPQRYQHPSSLVLHFPAQLHSFPASPSSGTSQWVRISKRWQKNATVAIERMYCLDLSVSLPCITVYIMHVHGCYIYIYIYMFCLFVWGVCDTYTYIYIYIYINTFLYEHCHI